MATPNDYKFMRSHEWLREQGDTVQIGISDHAQQAMGELVFVDLPAVGDVLTKGEPFADVESVKAVSGVFSPVTGVVVSVNEALMDSPELINEDPYGAWFVQVGELTDKGALLDAAAYEKLLAEEE